MILGERDVESKSDDARRDQGTMLGVISALNAVGALIGPIVSAPMLTLTETWSGAAVGLPYAFMAALMLPIVATSVGIYLRPYQ
jgi:hypothetical protein